jgi:hypothetical protein
LIFGRFIVGLKLQSALYNRQKTCHINNIALKFFYNKCFDDLFTDRQFKGFVTKRYAICFQDPGKTCSSIHAAMVIPGVSFRYGKTAADYYFYWKTFYMNDF